MLPKPTNLASNKKIPILSFTYCWKLHVSRFSAEKTSKEQLMCYLVQNLDLATKLNNFVSYYHASLLPTLSYYFNSQFITVSHYISQFLTLVLFPIFSHCWSLYLTVSHCISQFPPLSHSFSLYFFFFLKSLINIILPMSGFYII